MIDVIGISIILLVLFFMLREVICFLKPDPITALSLWEICSTKNVTHLQKIKRLKEKVKLKNYTHEELYRYYLYNNIHGFNNICLNEKKIVGYVPDKFTHLYMRNM